MASLAEIAGAALEARVRLTPQAHLLIKVVLESITEDPHLSWGSKNDGHPQALDELETEQQKLTTQLPELLRSISQYETVRQGIVSTFDVLHWLSGRLDGLCPMRKLPKE